MKFTFKKNSTLSFLLLCFLLISNKGFCYEKISTEIPVRQESVTVIKNERVPASSDKYKITAGDVLSVSVYGEPDLLQTQIIVRPDGYATVNPVGEVYVAGLDINEITKALQEKFKSFLNEPKLSVNIIDFNPAVVYVFGAVQKPGTYQQMIQLSKYYADSKNPTVRTDLTLANVISNVGGVTIDADLSSITVTSSDKKETKVDLWKFIKDKDISQNIKLKSGDTVYIPKVDSVTISDDDFKMLTKMSLFPATFPIRVVGEVKKANTISLSGESPYLNTAIASADGYTLDASKTIVVVYRKASNDKLAKIFVDPFKQDFVLRPNDLVEVRKRTFMKFVYGMDYFSRILTPFNIIPSASNSWADLIDPQRRYVRY